MKNSDTPPLQFEILSGSERAGGNTEQISEHVQALLVSRGCSAGITRLRELKIEPCGRCGQCNTRNTRCHVGDDMPYVIDRLRAADGIVYVAPVHGYGMAHPMQIFIERAGVGYLRFDRPLANKVGGAIVTGRRYAHEAVFQQFVSNLLLNRMIIVGSGYPAVLHGGRPGAALQDDEGLESVRTLIARMAGMARLLREVPAELRQELLSPDTTNERATSPAVPITVA